MSKHTPGPWSVYRGKSIQIGTEDVLVAMIRESSYTEGNARLISAAPDLLYALIALVERGTDSPEHMAA